METNIEICPKCGQVRVRNSAFCVGCGHKYQDTNSPARKYNRSFVDTIRERASSARDKTGELVSREKASQAVQNMVEVVTYVAQDIKQGMSSEMVDAVTVNARVSFVAFSIGVSIALDKLPMRVRDTKMLNKKKS
jgi:uncharacterized Zn finger protein (UPF0148 family)